MCTHDGIARTTALGFCRRLRNLWFKKSSGRGWMGPFLMAVFVETANSFAPGNYKTNVRKTKKWDKI